MDLTSVFLFGVKFKNLCAKLKYVCYCYFIVNLLIHSTWPLARNRVRIALEMKASDCDFLLS